MMTAGNGQLVRRQTARRGAAAAEFGTVATAMADAATTPRTSVVLRVNRFMIDSLPEPGA